MRIRFTAAGTRDRKRENAMGIIYFDICSIPLFLIILFICYSRKMTKGSANRLFILLVLLSLFSAAADLCMELSNNSVPLNAAGRTFCAAATYVYLIVRNATNATLLLFLLALTRTTFLIRKTWARIAFFLPYGCILVMLAQNPFTNSAFTVTAEHGYARGPLMLAFYGVALIYGLAGFVYCIYCRRYLPANNWRALVTVYLLVHLAVLVQYFHPELLLEMFSTAVGEMLITLVIMRPEERMDRTVGMLSRASYQTDIRNILLSGERVQILVIRIPNGAEIRNFLGDYEYSLYISGIADGVRAIRWKHPHHTEVYYERPDTIYLIADEDEPCTENIGALLRSGIGDRIGRYAKMGMRFEPQTCLIRCPDDLNRAEDILSLGHKFPKLARNQTNVLASELVHTETFAVEAHIEEILDRAIRHGGVELHYQPIFDVRTGRFRSAEALARIRDPEYGMISPAVFIPAAETLGFIIPIGDAVLEQAFRFLSAHDPDALGLSSLEVNLSVAQCMESDLPEKIGALQQKYGVDPGRINLEITETTFANISENMVQNVDRLIGMGYSFALDDYGTGYSSIQRVNNIPLKLIKIDKSMLDEASSDNGRKILEHTVRMMQSIGKKTVAEGAETDDAVELLTGMHCDFIQGFRFSRPLPEGEFVRFMEERNGRSDP